MSERASINGIIPVIKPPRITSHDVVAICKRLIGADRVGHTGTLDPAAVGLVVVCFGEATRIIQFMDGMPKGYRAEIRFGWTTDTQDSTGKEVDRSPGFRIPLSTVDEVLRRFIGEIEQVPPMVSALKIEGERLYDLARRGVTVARSPRRVTIHSLRRVAMGGSSPSFDPAAVRYGETVMIDVECSSGTYIRTLCEDIGKALGVCAHMSFLVRRSTSGYTLDDAITLDELDDACGGSAGSLREARDRSAAVDEYLFPVEHALRHIPEIRCAPSEDRLVSNGQIPHRIERQLLAGQITSDATGGLARIHLSTGRLALVCETRPHPGNGDFTSGRVIVLRAFPPDGR